MNPPSAPPVAVDPGALEALYRRFAEEALVRWLPRDSPGFAGSLGWVQSRFGEGRSLSGLLGARLGEGARRVLDLGAGNGGVSLGLAAEGHRVVACDAYLNGEVAELRSLCRGAFAHAVGDGRRLPFASAAFDAVLLLDVIEHVADASALAREAARVLRPGGLLVVTTPPRARFLFRGDPHHGIRGLAWLPAGLQRLVAERLLRRTSRYDVAHLYWSVRDVARVLPADQLALAAEGGKGRLVRLGLDWERLVAVRR